MRRVNEKLIASYLKTFWVTHESMVFQTSECSEFRVTMFGRNTFDIICFFFHIMYYTEMFHYFIKIVETKRTKITSERTHFIFFQFYRK